ncbi:hypothetical protein LJC68_09700 [Bacteroidales bacterium OttesenSCG-928-B11]|nr:hypothetical protein [Bacteroidales bacterium OttesenSCG-928-B11]
MKPLVFKTYNTPTMVLTCGGSVGLGTSSPAANLHIHQAERPECGLSIPGGGTTQSVSAPAPISSFLLTNLYTGASAVRGFKIALISTSLTMKNSENGSVSLLSTSNHGVIIGPTGRVTIGNNASYSANTSYKLYVDGGMLVNHAANGDWGYALNINVNRDLTKAVTVVHPTDGEVFRVLGNGTTYAKFITSKQIRVAVNGSNIFWPDYVFAPEYKLMPLKEVEQFVKENRHLPDIPSEEDVLNNGIDVAEMNALLLKKVEELTLYIIDLEKRVSSMEDKKGGE